MGSFHMKDAAARPGVRGGFERDGRSAQATGPAWPAPLRSNKLWDHGGPVVLANAASRSGRLCN